MYMHITVVHIYMYIHRVSPMLLTYFILQVQVGSSLNQLFNNCCLTLPGSLHQCKVSLLHVYVPYEFLTNVWLINRLARRLTGRLVDQPVRTYMYNLCIIHVHVLTITLTLDNLKNNQSNGHRITNTHKINK